MTCFIQTQHSQNFCRRRLLTPLMSPQDTKCRLIAVAGREVHLQQVWCDMALRYPRPQPALGGHPCMLLQGLCGIQNPLPLFVFMHVTLQTLLIEPQQAKRMKLCWTQATRASVTCFSALLQPCPTISQLLPCLLNCLTYAAGSSGQ